VLCLSITHDWFDHYYVQVAMASGSLCDVSCALQQRQAHSCAHAAILRIHPACIVGQYCLSCCTDSTDSSVTSCCSYNFFLFLVPTSGFKMHDIFRKLCGTYGGRERCAQGVGGGKPEGKRPLGRPRRRWQDNIKMDLQEVGWVLWGTGWSWLRIGTDGGRL
jgi:hypothetical protein